MYLIQMIAESSLFRDVQHLHTLLPLNSKHGSLLKATRVEDLLTVMLSVLVFMCYGIEGYLERINYSMSLCNTTISRTSTALDE
jgi:hypothetical protein